MADPRIEVLRISRSLLVCGRWYATGRERAVLRTRCSLSFLAGNSIQEAENVWFEPHIISPFVHFFGFAQGGSVAAEFVLDRWKSQLIQKHRISHPAPLVRLSPSPGPYFPTLPSQNYVQRLSLSHIPLRQRKLRCHLLR